MSEPPRGDRISRWVIALVAASTPLVLILAAALWATPYPLSESVALLEDVQREPASTFFRPTTAYYRPLYHLTLWSLLHGTGSLGATLTLFRVVHITAAVSVIVLLIWRLRPRRAVEAVAAFVAIAVLVGAPGFRDNLEIPLSYTLVGMPLALAVWMLSERDLRAWHLPAIVALTLIAIGYKEQGLILVPLIVTVWWMGAPGVSRATAATVAMLAAGYLLFRLSARGSWPVFAQDIGFGYGMMSPSEATARFGAFPLWIYVYNGASTMANVLFSQPTAGMFTMVEHAAQGETALWEINQLLSSIALTALITWWGIGSLRRHADGRWSLESRVFAAVAVTLVASGVLSFNYSRDRLGGIAAVFYAIAAFFAVRAAAERAIRARLVAGGVALLLVGGAWEMRAIGTIEYARRIAAKNQREWITDLDHRRTEFADRPVYLRTMEAMVDQGVPHALPHEAGTAQSLAEAIQHREVEQAYAFVRAGQNPNELVSFRDSTLTGDRTVKISPLMLAAATHSDNALMMLLAFGAEPSLPQNRFALCVAKQFGDGDIVRILTRDGHLDAAVQCPATTAQAPLLAFVNVEAEPPH